MGDISKLKNAPRRQVRASKKSTQDIVTQTYQVLQKLHVANALPAGCHRGRLQPGLSRSESRCIDESGSVTY